MANAKQIEDKTKEPEDELAGSEAPLLDHLIELRKRLIYSAVALVVLMMGCFVFAGSIFDVLLQPYRGVYTGPEQLELIYTAPQELFFTQLNIAFFGAMFLGFPFIASQIYMFVAPGLYKHERKAFIPYLVATPVFFLLGAAMVYFVVLPMALHFFAGMQTEEIRMLTQVSEYLGLAMTLILAFGICFQLPVILTLLAQIDLVHVEHAQGRAALCHCRYSDLCRVHHPAGSDLPDRSCCADVPALRTGYHLGSHDREAAGS